MSLSFTTIIIGITVLVSYLGINDTDLRYKLTLSPYAVKHHKRWWLIFSHGLVHADFGHLAMNMFTLYFLGSNVEGIMEYAFGARGQFLYLALYIGGLAFATIPSFYKHGENPGYLALGASGAVSAVVFASIIFLPLQPLYIMFIPIGIPGIIVGIAYLAFEIYANKQNRTNIAHDAHIAGAIFGVLFLVLVDYRIYIHFYYEILGAIG